MKKDSLIQYERLQYFRAICYKNIGDYDKASNDYKALEVVFNQHMGQDIIKYVVGIVLLPLQDDRKLQCDFIENFQELMEFYSFHKGKLDDTKTLSQFVDASTGRLDTPNQRQQILDFLARTSFFQRVPMSYMEQMLD